MRLCLTFVLGLVMVLLFWLGDCLGCLFGCWVCLIVKVRFIVVILGLLFVLLIVLLVSVC